MATYFFDSKRKTVAAVNNPRELQRSLGLFTATFLLLSRSSTLVVVYSSA